MTSPDDRPKDEAAPTAAEGDHTPAPSDKDTGLRVTRAALNFLAIFLGVSLSFLAEDWREELNELEDGERVLQGVLTDIQQDLPAARFSLTTDSAGTAAGLWLHQNWERDDLPLDSIDLALGRLHGGRPYIPVRSEYESAKYAGRLQYIPNLALRQQLISLYESTQPFLVELYDLRIGFVFEFWRQLRPYEGFAPRFGNQLVVPPIHLAAPWEEVQMNEVLRNAMVQSISFQRVFYQQLRAYILQAQLLQEGIRAELDGRWDEWSAEQGQQLTDSLGGQAPPPSGQAPDGTGPDGSAPDGPADSTAVQ